MHAAMAWLRLLCWLSSFIRAESSAPGAPPLGKCISTCPGRTGSNYRSNSVAARMWGYY